MGAGARRRCGAQFTSKLEGMITDLSLAADIQKRFREHMEHINAKDAMAGMDFFVRSACCGSAQGNHAVGQPVAP